MTPEPRSQLASYRLDASASALTVYAFAEGLFSAFGHDPVISIREFSGEVAFMPETFENASLTLTIKTDSLVATNDIKAKDREEMERTMYDQVLETKTYPEIHFKSNNVSLSRLGEGRFRARVIGDLTLHGVTQNNLWLNGEVTITNEGLRAKGEFAIKQSDFKIKPVSVAGGTLKIKNEVKCSFAILAKPV